MPKEARLPLGNPPEPMGGSALVAFQLLLFPHGPLDQNAITHPAGHIQRCFVVRPIVVHPSTPDGIAHAGEIVESLVTPEMHPPAPDSLPHRFGGPCTHRGTAVDTVLPPTILGPSWANGIAQTVKAIVRGTPAPIGLLTVHDGCLGRMECQMTLRPSGGKAGFEPVGWRRTLTMRDAIISIALAGDGRMCSVPPGRERVLYEEMREERADTPPCGTPWPRWTRVPSWPCTGAWSHRATYRRGPMDRPYACGAPARAAYDQGCRRSL